MGVTNFSPALGQILGAIQISSHIGFGSIKNRAC